ncbi:MULTISPECIES: GNAT family N-acetyltransferase [Streptomyces]|uniref:GNAT family N-acetyltransferase n=1 Tax=Streptomyces TaxID=1883 RepID=UPI0022494BB9|nr:GNAT family N-acetyltransferase [Streptomyces sp. JHD 1]MCX2968486.1 GNAT family N-acetyltransferase [Streptomyces sp. JHD 1]
MLIRRGQAGDLPRCQEIERAAGEGFRALGMAPIADDDPPPTTVLDAYRRAGGLWVVTAAEAAAGSTGVGRTAAGGTGVGGGARAGTAPAVGYLLALPVDGATHVEQVSVHPDAARRGLGRALLDHVQRAHGNRPLTLTTFRDVPWNAPYYARLGFVALAEERWTPGLREIRAHEAELGLDRWPRLCMRRAPLPPAAS